MDRTNRTTVVGVFDNRDQADRAVEELRRLGFRDDQIGYAMRGGDNTVAEGTGNAAGEGLATGAVIGGLVGAAAALLIPGIGPVVAGGVLASVLGGAAVGAAAGGILGALVGMGIPEEEATYYESEFQAGRILVTVKADGRAAEAREVMRRFGAYDVENRGGATGGTDRMAAMSTGAGAGAHSHTHTHRDETHAHEHGHTGEHAHQHGSGGQGEASVKLREEQLTAQKQTVQAGEVEIGKRVVSEQRTMEVPVTREEVTIERTPVNRPANTPVGADNETVRVPVHEERVEFEKRPVVTEEVSVNKRQVQDVERHTATVNREEAVIHQNWNTWEEARPHYQNRWQQRFGASGGRWDEYEPHYRFGWEMSRRPEYQGKQWNDFESQWQRDWEANNQGHPWERAKEGARDAWEWASGTQVRR